jgi:iron complex outermembrane receptor protein
MISLRSIAFAGVSLLTLATPAFAQDVTTTSEDAANASGDIIVTARRREESLQEVPLVVNAVTNRTLEKLNIRDLREVTSVVPGLSLVTNANGVGSIATLRGINFDVNSSGNNGTVEFYLNDEPVSSGVVLQSMFDIGQIEVLRGPQGTLRGRASPSGSITVTTRLPDMDQFGGYLNGTMTTLDQQNLQGGLNIPIIKGMLALRVAGLFDDNDLNRVRSLNPNAHGVGPRQETRSERVTLEFKPTDNIDIVGRYQHFVTNWRVYDQVESANFAVPGLPASPVAIAPGDRLSVMDLPRSNRNTFDIFNVQAEWRFAGQKLNFVFGHTNSQLWSNVSPNDIGNFYSGAAIDAANPVTAPNDPYATGFNTKPNLNNMAQSNHSTSNQRSYELRLSSDERLFGMVDYVVGGLINQSIIPFNLWSNQPLFIAFPALPFIPLIPNGVAVSNIVQTGSTIEHSAFGNVNVHIGDATEISGGVRYISYKTDTVKTLQTSAAAAPTPLPGNLKESLHHTIWSASIKHRFNDSIMAYASAGSSWRASAQTNGIIDGISGLDRFPYGNLANILHLDPETSTSYEVGFKTDWLDRRLHVNVSYYHQDFKNYFYSSPFIQVAQRVAIPPGGSTTGPNVGDVYAFNTLQILAVNVPAKVDGVEGEIGFQVTPDWSMSATLSYSSSKIKNGQVPCNLPAAAPFYGVDGAAFVNANGGQQYGTCTANFRAGNSAPFSGSFQTEYSHELTDRFTGFIRALVTYNGNSQNDPTNPIDDIKAYGLVNLFLGLRDPNGMWELTGYAKNLFDTQRVLTRDANPLATSFTVINLSPTRQFLGTSGQAGITTYRAITMTPPREFGLNLRVSFGSR